MSASIKLRIFNAALGHIGERKLASLSENREPRRVLDDYYDTTIAYCLEQGQWKFGSVRLQRDASTSVTPDFGFTNAFTKPDDWLRTTQISDNANFGPPLERFTEVGGFWYADCDPIYVNYISSAATAGGDDSQYTATFESYVSLRLAAKICTRLSGSETKKALLQKEERKELAAARNLNQSGNAPIYQAVSSWVTSRFSGLRNSRWDRRS